MKGRGWIRKQRLVDAQEVREHIARLEQELIAARAPNKRAKLHDIGHQLQTLKSRLERLERCISGLKCGQSGSGRSLAPSRAALDGDHAARISIPCDSMEQVTCDPN
ncbi:hypothetical protein LB542_06720 [Mesorhizobium sp. BR1-1-9]|uniref:hypothetical protein n=1 Tax=Mesorhizobium sp. BR1-1-9 TaxID=2876646 RepID=UPI001CD08721|nr:hypothetical protein [Mesorhizobium sp. BR1-1-9]MBZ9870547.1 hypothetical protein [Mesorhizobium sp. BR1-1-9]